MDTTTSQLVYGSGEVEVDLGRRELRVRGVSVPIGGRAFEIIEILIEAAGELVTKNDLMNRVWPGAIVEENTLWVHISAVRKALGPERGLLKTVAGRGYRLTGTWRSSESRTPIGNLAVRPAVTSSAPDLSNNLPTSGTTLIGRVQAMQELLALLSAYRVITLTGVGGIGKTRLAIETARQMLAGGHSEVWLVEFASMLEPELLPSTIARVVGLHIGIADISDETVARAIGNRNILLVLDNCEHIVEAVAKCAETIVRLCPQATILATSREVLRIDGEHVYRVPPFDVPGERATPDSILGSSAVQLFLERTRAIRSTFSPDEKDLRAIASICQRLDGIPLAIEFAAARAATLGVSQVNAHLNDRFNLLTAGRRTTLARHQTLRAALDWSYDLLTPSEQRLLRHASIFPAGFTVEAATAVMDDAGHQTAVMDGIANLVDKSLAVLDASAPGGRWRLLETIRAYGLEKLRENGEAESALRRHAEYFRLLLSSAGTLSPLEPGREALIRYDREIDNIRAAIDWCFSPVGEVSIGTAITARFVPMSIYLAQIAECRRRTEQALASLNQSNDDAPTRMLLHIGLGIALNHTGARSGDALKSLTTGLRIAEELGDAIAQMYALWALWITYGYKGNFRATGPVAEKFFALSVSSADPARGYLADRLMGTTLHYRGNQPKAREHLDRVAEQYRRSLEQPQGAWFGYNLSDFSQSTLARVLCMQGFLDQARNLAQACLDRTRLPRQKVGLCFSLVEAACPISLMLQDMETATRHVALLAAAAAELDLIYWKTMAGCLHGVLLVRQGDFDTGLAALRASLKVCDEFGGASRYPMFLGAVAKALSGLGQVKEARATLDKALARADRDGEEWCVPDLLCEKGELAERESGPAALLEAEDCFSRANTMARQQGASLWELRSALHLARLRVGQKRREEAWQILAPAYGQFSEGFDTVDLRAAKMMLEALSHEK